MQIPASILAEYRRAREAAEAEAAERTRAACALLPQLAALLKERRALAYSLPRLQQNAADPARIATGVREQTDALNAQIAALLAKNGFPEDALAPHYRCPRCGDTGFEGERRTLCACLRQRLLEMQFSDMGIAEGERFDAFREDIYPTQKQRKMSLAARRICLEYAEGFPNEDAGRQPNLLLMGDAGLGKSFLLNAIAHRVRERGFAVLKVTAYSLISDTMAAFRRGERAPDCLSADLLMLDDLGTEPMIPNVTLEQLFAVLNERQARNKPIACATNLTAEQLQDRYGERLFSRLISPRTTAALLLSGENLRLCRSWAKADGEKA